MKKAFTLIELLIVISIIGILSVSLLPSILSAPSSARNVIRKKALIEMQAAVERYKDDRGAYPTTGGGWLGTCWSGSTTSGPTGYIPNLAPDYIKILPTDPTGKRGTSAGSCTDGISCYMYRTDAAGTTYKIMSHCAYENPYPTASENFYDPARTTWAIKVCGPTPASAGCGY